MEKDNKIGMNEKRYSFSIRFFSVLLAVVLLAVTMPFASVSAAAKQLVLSDCTSGWQYRGNSEIDYSVEGTDGTGLEVTAGYGSVRRLTYSFAASDLTEFDRIDWDMRIFSKSGQTDLFPDVRNAYKDTFCFVLKDAAGREYKFPQKKINFTVTANGWYHGIVRLSDCVGLDLTRITAVGVAVCETNGFNNSIPAVTCQIDSFVANMDHNYSPKIVGFQ